VKTQIISGKKTVLLYIAYTLRKKTYGMALKGLSQAVRRQEYCTPTD